MSEYPSKLEELLENLELTYDRDERIQMLIDIADRFKGVPDHIASRPYPKSHLTPACESEAYVWSEVLPNQSLRYHFAVETPQGISAKALAVILNETLSACVLVHHKKLNRWLQPGGHADDNPNLMEVAKKEVL